MKKLYKKYPNRRLYDVEKSCYVNIEEVKRSVMLFAEIQVVDAKTNEDITTSILLQILNQQNSSNSGNKVITAQALSNLIRLYEHPLGAMMSASIDSMMQWLNQQTANLPSQAMQNFWMQPSQKQYMDMWQQAWTGFMPQSQNPTHNQDPKS